MKKYKQLLKDCFWDLNFSDKDIDDILKSNDFRRKKFLFNKILLNSKNMLVDFKLFRKEELKAMLEEYRVPQFRHEYIFRRKNIAEVYFFDKPLLIKELQWVA